MRKRKIFRSFLTMVLALCIIFTEWGTFGITVNAANSSLSISGASTISSINKGSSWTCKGTVSSNYALKEVRGTIYESDGMTVKYRKSVYPSGKSYTIQNGEIDKALLFNKLQAGTYHYTIVASDASGVTKTLVNNKFTVKGSGGSTLKITGASTISSLKQGNSWTCSGTVSSNYVLKEVRGTIYESDGITVKYRKSVYPNSKSYTIQNKEIDKALLFNKLPAGTFYYTIVASDVSGRTLTLVNNKFTVSGSAVSAASTLKITGAGTISSLQQGNSWTCSGTISSNYNISHVGGYILGSDHNTIIYSKTVQPNSKSYSLANSAIDKALLFNKLSAGTYYYKITAHDASGNRLTLIDTGFTVKGKETSSLKISGASTISSLKQGNSWTCSGTVSSNYALKEVRGTIYESDGVTVKYRKSVYPNSKSYKIQNGEIDKALLFNKLSAGTYHYTIVASDASGTSKTLVNNKFTVQGNAASTLKIAGASTLSTLTKGSSWTCTGTISSNYAITKVTGYILNSNGSTKYSKSVAPNKTSYTLKNSAIDSALKFNNLSAGTYTYKITATDASGKTLTLIENKFTVTQAASTLKIAGAGTLSTLTKGASWTCTGTISSNYAITKVTGYILNSNGSTKYSKSVAPNKTSYTLKNSAIDSALKFNNLSAGTYTYKITATDASGKTLTLIENKFTVTQAASTMKISGAGTPGTLTKGSSWTCTGTISSNYAITKVTGYILNSNGSTKYSKPVTLNKTSYTLKNSAIDSALKFNKLSVGTYTYKITATDKSGKTATLVNAAFTVKEASIGGTRKVLSIDKTLIAKVGSMKSGDSTCGAYSWAYCTTFRDKKAHYYSEYWKYSARYEGYVAYWTGGTSNNPTNASAALKKVYDAINTGKPCVLRVTQKSGGGHYIMVYGYTNVSDPNNMGINNLVFIDPYAYKGEQYYDGNGSTAGNIKKVGLPSGGQQVITY